MSRQAVTKWEANQSAPSTQKLFKLAEIFGTSVDLLLTDKKAETDCLAERIFDLYKKEEEKKGQLSLAKRKNLLLTSAVITGYLLVYLVGRMFRTTGEPVSVLWWLIGDEPQDFHYLYGWLIHNKLFWLSMAASAVPALFGKKYYSFTTLLGFVLGLLLGELCGQNPAGAAYGHGHYGWAIWGCIFIFSLGMGIVLERMERSKANTQKSRLWIWLAIFAAGVLVIVLAIRMGMPVRFS